MKRFRKTLKWTGILLGALVAILLIANACFVWITDARLERRLAAIREAGDPLSLAELAREPIPPEKNAATFLRRAEADVEAIDREVGNLRYGYPEGQGGAKERKIIGDALAAYPRVIPLLQQAAACADYDAQGEYTVPSQEFLGQMLSPIQKSRAVARVLCARAWLLVAEGNRDEAVRTALVSLRLARHFEHNPTLVSLLVAIALRNIAIDDANMALQAGPVSKEVRDALDAELTVQDRMDGYAWAVKSERALGLDTFRTLPGRNFWFLRRGLWNQWELKYLDLMDAFLALTADPRPYWQSDHSIRQVWMKISPVDETLNELIFPATQAVHAAVARARARIRSLRVLNALQARTSAGSDAVPKLSDLGLPADATTDPFTGDPLHVKKTPRGWLVYSVGDNLQDDGGKIDGFSDVGIGPPPPAAKPDAE
jgi:HAMP domain-containing protein